MEIWYPFDWRPFPIYEIVYFFQMIAQCLMVLQYNNTDMFFAAVMLLTGKQFELLGYNFANMYYNELLLCNFKREEVDYFFENAYDHKNLNKSVLE